MASRLGPLLLGAGALLLLSRRTRAEPTEEPAAKPKPESKPKPGADPKEEPAPGPKPGPELIGPLPPGDYTAKDGEKVMIDMSIPGVSPILGMKATRDGEEVQDVYSGLISGFEVEFRLEGIEVLFLQEGEYEIFTIPVIVNSDDETINYEVSLSEPSVWKFLVEGVVNA